MRRSHDDSLMPGVLEPPTDVKGVIIPYDALLGGLSVHYR